MSKILEKMLEKRYPFGVISKANYEFETQLQVNNRSEFFTIGEVVREVESSYE